MTAELFSGQVHNDQKLSELLRAESAWSKIRNVNTAVFLITFPIVNKFIP